MIFFHGKLGLFTLTWKIVMSSLFSNTCSIIFLNSIFLSSIVHIKSWHIANEHYACKNISFLVSMFNILFVWLKRHQRDEKLLSTQHFRHSYQQSWQDLGSFCFLNKQNFFGKTFFPKEWIHTLHDSYNANKLNTYPTIKQSISK